MGFLNPLYVAVAWVMARIHAGLSLFLNPDGGLAWALTIVVLVAAMRLLLVPLFIKQMHSMRKMSALTPQLQELRKKYKGDKQTLNEETMRLYREAGVNPLGGCLPLVAQLPMFFALFNVLRGIADWKSGPTPYGLSMAVVKSAQNANILGAKISDKVLFTPHGLNVSVEAKIVICCAVAISVVTTFLTVRQSTKRGMTPQMTPDNPMAASQKYMAYIVPFFALSGLYWAFGLVLYWVTTNVWTLGQQYLLFKRYPPTAPEAAGTTGATSAPATPATAPRLTAGGRPAANRPASDAVKRPPARPAPTRPADGKLADGRPAATKPGATTGAGTAKPANGKSAASGQTPPARPGAARPGAAKPGTARPGTGRPAAAKPAAAKPAASSPPPGKKSQSRQNGQAAPGNGAGSSPGLLRRFGRGKAEPEEQPGEPEAKLVRQQRVRQSRSKRSGKR